MKQTAENIIKSRIAENARGWAFSPSDFFDVLSRKEIDMPLSRLEKKGEIRRVLRGIYDLPLYSNILKKEVAPDINQIAYAIARKFKWKIYPDGNTALNYLGLSNQMVAKNIYLSDGPSKKYKIGNRELEFKHTTQRESTLEHSETALVIQAIRAVGELQITDKFLTALSQKFSPDKWDNIIKDASHSAEWIYNFIKKIALLNKGNKNG